VAQQFAADDGGQAWRCLASGHGMRRSVVDGKVVMRALSGILEPSTSSGGI
jgi:hypothetical protein